MSLTQHAPFKPGEHIAVAARNCFFFIFFQEVSVSVEQGAVGESREVEVVILGAGSAGLSALRQVTSMRCDGLLIDPGPFGTTCARVGCMPSKLLIAAADAAHEVQRAPTFGVEVEAAAVHVNGEAVKQRVRFERDRFVEYVYRSVIEREKEGRLLRGRATIRSQGVLDVEHLDGTTSEVRYERLILAVGSRPMTPPPFRHLTEEVMLTNDSVFELEDLPESLFVVGLGVIGLELGQAMHRLGVRTTLVGKEGMIGPLHDEDLVAEATRIFKQELDLHTDYQLHEITQREDGSGVDVRFVDSDGKTREEFYEKVLMAAGRRSNIDRVGLENLGVHPDDDGKYGINKGTLQLRDFPIFVAGDVNQFHPLLHEASDDGRIAGENAVKFPEVLAPRRRTKLSITFCDPQIAVIGHNDEDFHEQDIASGTLNYNDQGRARVMAVNRGMIKVYGDYGSGALIGGEFFCPRAEHMSHLLAWAIQSGLTVTDALAMPFYHPVLEEGFRTALRNLSVEIKQRASIKCRVAELGVGS